MGYSIVEREEMKIWDKEDADLGLINSCWPLRQAARQG